MMTVRELTALLAEHDQDRIVVLSRDAEGNGYSPLCAIGTGAYRRGEVGLEVLTEEDRRLGFTEEDVMRGAKALILTPG
jgi:hypothetical protein